MAGRFKQGCSKPPTVMLEAVTRICSLSFVCGGFLSGARRLFLKQPFKVAAGMQQAGDMYRAGCRVINDKIRKHLPEFHRRVGKVFSAVSNSRHIPQKFKRRLYFVQDVLHQRRPALSEEIDFEGVNILLGVGCK